MFTASAKKTALMKCGILLRHYDAKWSKERRSLRVYTRGAPEPYSYRFRLMYKPTIRDYFCA